MKLCSIAWFVFIFSMACVFIDIWLIGFSVKRTILDIVSVIIFVFIANWACYSHCCNWIAWVIVVFILINAFSLLFVIRYKDTPMVQEIIKEEKANSIK